MEKPDQKGEAQKPLLESVKPKVKIEPIPPPGRVHPATLVFRAGWKKP